MAIIEHRPVEVCCGVFRMRDAQVVATIVPGVAVGLTGPHLAGPLAKAFVPAMVLTIPIATAPVALLPGPAAPDAASAPQRPFSMRGPIPAVRSIPPFTKRTI